MLEKAVVRRFQKHKKVIVKFGPRVTVLVGETDAGKSTFLRALLFAFFSRWKPAYHRHGATATSVELHIDGHKIVRKKGKGVNAFYLDGKKLSAVGKNGVPPEVARVFNISPANVQSQLDPPFWFSETPGAISKKLNKIVNLELIDESLANAGAGVREADRRLKDAREELRVAKQNEEKSRWVDDFLVRAAEVVKLAKLAEEKQEECEELESLVKSVRRHGRTVRALEKAVRCGEEAVAAGRETFILDDQCRQLEELVSQVKEHERAAGVRLPDIEEVRKVQQEGNIVADDCSLLEELVSTTKKARRETLLLKMELVAKKDQLDHLKSKVKRCEKCGSLLPRSGTSTAGHKPRCAAARKTGGRSKSDTSDNCPASWQKGGTRPSSSPGTSSTSGTPRRK